MKQGLYLGFHDRFQNPFIKYFYKFHKCNHSDGLAILLTDEKTLTLWKSKLYNRIDNTYLRYFMLYFHRLPTQQ